jgi:hypothetical protein
MQVQVCKEGGGEATLICVVMAGQLCSENYVDIFPSSVIHFYKLGNHCLVLFLGAKAPL